MVKKINTILVANRGEIAVRIMKTAKQMGIKTVAVYSDVDANAKFVSEADIAIPIGGTTSRESYLVIDKIIDACKKSGADAVHPGYGFLSEKAEFVERCNKEGIVFIGPSTKSMEMMGDKITSKETAKKAGVSVVPGFLGTVENEQDATKIVNEIGLPVIIKASAGGGGKGMKIVYSMEELMPALNSAKNEAKNAFGDDRLFIEKYIERPHHIEIQLIGDQHGNIVCLGERECSIQRFNQKVIEESPSPFISDATRKKMYEQSTKLAKECGYYSAGTIEYIMDKDQNFYFLEMNTRLQVEHPVTEFVTGKDLVKLMIQVAQGETLSFTQNDIVLTGNAIECRICAEDPSKGFMPSIGRISHYKEPGPIHNVKFRIDSGIVEGSEISPHYDSMIAKIITHGDTRKEAISSMKKVLGKFELFGIATNINLLEDIMRNSTFVAGDVSTWFIKEEYSNGFKGTAITDEVRKTIIASVVKFHLENESRAWTTSGQYFLPRDAEDQTIWIQVGEDSYNIKYNIGQDDIIIYFDDNTIHFKSSYKPGDVIISGEISGMPTAMKIISAGVDNLLVACAGIVAPVKYSPRHISEYAKYMPVIDFNKKPDQYKAPIAGMCVKFCVKDGDTVMAGQELLVIEAMKMENVIRADFDTKIKKIHGKAGTMLSVGELLIDFDNTEN